MTRTTGEHRIVVLGAGYTGMMCALRVARRTRRHGGRVVLVNSSARFTERLRMHQIAAGEVLAEHRIPDVVAGTGVRFVQGRAHRIDLRRHEVRVDTPDGERALDYDTLVYAVGSVADTAVPGADAHAYTLDTPQAAARLAARLATIPAGTVTVCGGGLTGVEAAAEIAENHPEVRVVLLSRDVPGSTMGEAARGYLNRALERLGVQVRSGVEIVKVLPGAVELTGGETVASDAVVWTTGFTAHALAAEAGLTVDAKGRMPRRSKIGGCPGRRYRECRPGDQPPAARPHLPQPAPPRRLSRPPSPKLSRRDRWVRRRPGSRVRRVAPAGRLPCVPRRTTASSGPARRRCDRPVRPLRTTGCP